MLQLCGVLTRLWTEPSSRPEPRRLSNPAPKPSETYVTPVKQSLIADTRLGRGTVRFLLQLYAWSGGKREVIRTKQLTLANVLGVSDRQLRRYQEDAIRNGYMWVCYTKNRWGMITGMVYYLRHSMLKPDQRAWRKKKQCENRRIMGRTHLSDSNTNLSDSKLSSDPLDEALKQLGRTIGAIAPT